jgi:hypothetical protein
VVGTRRALLGAAGAALVAGCGQDGSSRLPPAGPTLDAQLRAQEDVVRAYEGLRGREVRRMAAAARSAAARLRAAGARAQPAAAASGSSVRHALAAEDAALAAHLAGLRAGPRRTRSLTTELVLTSAQHAAVLRSLLGQDPAARALP